MSKKNKLSTQAKQRKIREWFFGQSDITIGKLKKKLIPNIVNKNYAYPKNMGFKCESGNKKCVYKYDNTDIKIPRRVVKNALKSIVDDADFYKRIYIKNKWWLQFQDETIKQLSSNIDKAYKKDCKNNPKCAYSQYRYKHVKNAMRLKAIIKPLYEQIAQNVSLALKTKYNAVQEDECSKVPSSSTGVCADKTRTHGSTFKPWHREEVGAYYTDDFLSGTKRKFSVWHFTAGQTSKGRIVDICEEPSSLHIEIKERLLTEKYTLLDGSNYIAYRSRIESVELNEQNRGIKPIKTESKCVNSPTFLMCRKVFHDIKVQVWSNSAADNNTSTINIDRTSDALKAVEGIIECGGHKYNSTNSSEIKEFRACIDSNPIKYTSIDSQDTVVVGELCQSDII